MIIFLLLKPTQWQHHLVSCYLQQTLTNLNTNFRNHIRAFVWQLGVGIFVYRILTKNFRIFKLLFAQMIIISCSKCSVIICYLQPRTSSNVAYCREISLHTIELLVAAMK